MLRREAARDGAARALAMVVGGVLVAGVAAAALMARGTVAGLPAPAYGWMLGAALLAAVFVASNLALQYGAARLPANATAVIMITEVVFAAGSALMLGGGALAPRVAAGGALIMAAAVLAAWRR